MYFSSQRMCVSIVLVGGIMTWNEGLSRLEPTTQNLLQQINLVRTQKYSDKIGGQSVRAQ